MSSVHCAVEGEDGAVVMASAGQVHQHALVLRIDCGASMGIRNPRQQVENPFGIIVGW